MTVNYDKTKKIVFFSQASARPALPCPLVGTERVVSAKRLGVTFFVLMSMFATY